MAQNVNEAFDIFRKNTVNLDSDDSKKARSSRDWLIGKISDFPDDNSDFPILYTERNIAYGSFARKTKKRPLDDVDLMIALNAEGSTYNNLGNKVVLYISENANRLKKYCFENSNQINSIKIVNAFVKNLKGISQYSSADIKRNQEAATLNLISYDWVFDIVPCFFTSPESDGRNYYIIPDGNGHWKLTDPRIDRDRVKELNTNLDGRVLDIVRMSKYWNQRSTMPSMGSYLLENMLLDHFATAITINKYCDIEMIEIFNQLKTRVYNAVYDPKNIQGDINTLSWDEKTKIAARAESDYQKAKEARKLESDGDMKGSIKKWGEIFGPDFPTYD